MEIVSYAFLTLRIIYGTYAFSELHPCSRWILQYNARLLNGYEMVE